MASRKPPLVRSGPVTTPLPTSAKVTLLNQAGPEEPATPEEPKTPEGATVLAFPEPAFKRRRRIVWITSIAVLLAMAAVVAVVMLSPVFALKTMMVDGTKILSPEAVQAALAPLKDKPLTQISESQVKSLLDPIPQVHSVTVEARPPSTLLVHVVERVPVALLKSDSTYLLVDPDGVQLGSAADPAQVPLPLIDGGTSVIGQANFKAVTSVLAVLPPAVLGKLLKATASSPDAVELTLDDGKKVIWGNSSEQTLKAQVLQALLTAEPAKGVSVYDISSPRHPVTR